MVDTARYQYGMRYIPDLAAFKRAVLAKTVTPHQVEWQPGPPGQEICWLQCPYCYGGSAEMTDERLPLGRALDVMHELAIGPYKPDVGGVRKIIFAGYATDPLYNKDITALVTAALGYKMTVGFNTKALHVNDNLLATLDVMKTPGSYATVSVDAGSDAVYNAVHGVKGTPVLYTRVMKNIARLKETGVEVAATYLVNRLNCVDGNTDDMEKFISDACDAGVDVIRFAFAQLPRGATEMPTVPTQDECRVFADRIRFIKEVWDLRGTPILLADADAEHDLFRKDRTLPCVARWVYPTVGYDGWLYPCSQSAAPNFRAMALGNLAERGFWDMYYAYDETRLSEWMTEEHMLMAQTGCRCDRKEHITNAQASEAF